MRHPLIQLLADNRKTEGRRFEVVALADGEVEVFLYDAIVSDELEAEWWGGIAPGPFVKALRAIDATTIHLRINSPGGSVFAARAIEQAIREHPARVVAHIDGLAASAASFVMMAADEIVMGKGAMVMIHKAWTLAYGNADDFAAQAALLDKLDGTLVQTYADRTGQATDQLATWMADETWFTAAEAVEYGFADKVAEDSTDAKAQTTWNLNAFLAAGKPARPAALQAPAPASEEHRARQAQRLQLIDRLQTAPIA